MSIETTGTIIVNSNNIDVNEYIKLLSEKICQEKYISLGWFLGNDSDVPFITEFSNGIFGSELFYYGRKGSENWGLENIIAQFVALDPKIRLLITSNSDFDIEWTNVSVFHGYECVEEKIVPTDPIFAGLEKLFE